MKCNIIPVVMPVAANIFKVTPQAKNSYCCLMSKVHLALLLDSIVHCIGLNKKGDLLIALDIHLLLTADYFFFLFAV